MALNFGILKSTPMQFMFGCKNMELKRIHNTSDEKGGWLSAAAAAAP